MIITLYGSDAYRRKKKLDEIIASFIKKKADLSLKIIDVEEEGGLERAIGFWGTPSLFGDTKLLIIKYAFAITDRNRFKKFFKNAVVSREATLLLCDGTKQIGKEWAFLKEKPNLTQEFANLSNSKFASFVSEEAKAQNIVIQDSALDYFAKAFAPDSWGAVRELEKLALLGTSPISLDFLKNCGVRIEGDFFSYIFGWFQKSVPSKLKNLEELLIAKNDPAKIFNVLAYQDKSELRRFADYDVEVKSGRLEYEEVLLELAIT